MSKIHSLTAWACTLACLTMVLGTKIAIAQQQEDQQSQTGQSTQQDRDQTDRQDSQSRFQRDQQAHERDQQQRERAQQARQGQRDRQQYDRESVGRDAERSAPSQRGSEAGLGVAVLDAEEGVLVVRVHQDSPAQQMGLRRGDIITHLDGEEVESADRFVSDIRQKDPGDEIELDIQRGREEESVSGELRSRREALVLRNPRRDWQFPNRQSDSWQTTYQENRQSQSGTSRSGNIDGQLQRLEQQVNRLSQEIDQIRYALQDLRQQSDRNTRETTASYDEPQNRRWSDSRSGDWSEQNRSRSAESYRDGQSDRDYDRDRGEQRSRQSDLRERLRIRTDRD